MFSLRIHCRWHLGRLSLAALALAQAGTLVAQPLPKDSPFVPTGANSAAAAGDSALPYELVGMTKLGDATLIGITRAQDRQSYWIPVGHTVGDLTAVSYDTRTDQAVIRAGGQVLTLHLRTGSVAPSPLVNVPPSPAVVPTPNPGLPPGVPDHPMTPQEQKEMEARMLVTDLLEIGQQQRKAYEEAQRQAARTKAAKSAAPPSPVGADIPSSSADPAPAPVNAPSR